ncbi:MAG: type II toxin-antitoxin system VapC family toxin [Cocleimonas sp.]
MKCLIDTHILLWLLFNPTKVSDDKLLILEDPENEVYVSSLSFWEISLKYGLGKLDLSGVLPQDLPKLAQKMGINILEARAEEFSGYHQLARVDKHKDPFDRMIIWQAICNDLMLISVDRKFTTYTEFGLKLL